MAHSLLSGWRCLTASLWMYDRMYTALEFSWNGKPIVGLFCDRRGCMGSFRGSVSAAEVSDVKTRKEECTD
jgi:hypothetical protein